MVKICNRVNFSKAVESRDKDIHAAKVALTILGFFDNIGFHVNAIR